VADADRTPRAGPSRPGPRGRRLEGRVHLYVLATADALLRQRILRVIGREPLPYPSFWRAAMASLGETIDWSLPAPAGEGAP
jgi:hypothetical protein